MNALAALLALAAAGLVALVVLELRPDPAAPDPVASPNQAVLAAPAPVRLDGNIAPLVDTLLARPLFSQTRRLASVASPVAAATAATFLPRMTGILIDGTRRSAIFASIPGGKPSIVAEGGRIGPFTVQTIEPQQVIVIGPEGKRLVRTSFDPTLPSSPAAPQAFGLGAPLFPGIALGPPPGTPQPTGAAR